MVIRAFVGYSQETGFCLAAKCREPRLVSVSNHVGRILARWRFGVSCKRGMSHEEILQYLWRGDVSPEFAEPTLELQRT